MGIEGKASRLVSPPDEGASNPRGAVITEEFYGVLLDTT